MNLQIASTTQLQRNMKQVLAKLDSPVLLLRDSAPAAVMLSYGEYQRLANLEKQLLKKQMDDVLRSMDQKNRKTPDRVLNAAIKKARRAVSRH